jgi:Ca2+-binding EF-hand superfamily protein
LEEKRSQLFKAWDLDGDGFVDFSEMALGLHKIQPEAMLGGAADAAIGSILAFDTDNNQRYS